MKRLFWCAAMSFLLLCVARPAFGTAITTANAGNWSSGATWIGGVVPTTADDVTIDATHAVVIDATSVCQSLTIAATGSLSNTAHTLNIGNAALCTRNFIINGSLTISGTAIIHLYGNVLFNSGATFVQSGGNFNIDGNAAGVAANSVATGTHLCHIGTNNLTLSGGMLTIIDPHAATAGTRYAFYYAGGSAFNNTTDWTLQFGNGVSSDNGGDASNGFSFQLVNPFYIDRFILNATANGNNRFCRISANIGFNHLTITSGDFRQNSFVFIKSNLVNNGIYTHISNALQFSDYQSGTASAATVPATISGTGTFRNSTSTSTASFINLNIQNTSSTGVTIAVNNLSLSGTLTFTAGKLNIGSNTFSLGTSTTVIGSLSNSSVSQNKGIIAGSGGRLRRWYDVSTLTASVAQQGTFPLLHPTTGKIRSVWFTRGASNFTSGGYIEATFVHNSGITDADFGTEGSVTIQRRLNEHWIFTTGGGLNTGTHNLNIQIQAEGIGSVTNVALMRLVGANGLLNGTYSSSNSGSTTAPTLIRTGLNDVDLTVAFYMGVDKNVNPLSTQISTVQSGNWNDGTTWTGGVVPSTIDEGVISAGHTVTLDAPVSCEGVTIAATGILNVHANTLTVGPTGGGLRTFSVNGTLNLSGGTIELNGHLAVNAGANFNMTGGQFTVDGNSGNKTSSVATSTHLVHFQAKPVLSGGQFTIIDPPAAVSSFGNTLHYNVNSGSDYDIPVNGTLFQIGNGVSTHTGGHGNGYVLTTAANTDKLKFRDLVINVPSGNGRAVTLGNETVIQGNLTLTAGTFIAGKNLTPYTLYIGGQLTNQGTFRMPSTLYMGGYQSGAGVAATTAQTISGTGVFSNLFYPYLTISTSGSGYTVGDVLTVTGGTGTPLQFVVVTTSSGAIQTVSCLNAGDYTIAPTNPAATTGGTGTGATITLSSLVPTANMSRLTIHNTSSTGVTLSRAISLSNQLTLTAGRLVTSSTNLLSLNDGLTLSWTSGSGAIVGPVAKSIAATTGTHLFPLGDGTTEHPVTIEFTAAPIAGTLVAEYKATAPTTAGLPMTESGISIETVSPTGYWSVEATNGVTGGTYTITADATNFKTTNGLDITLLSQVRLIKRNVGGNWAVSGGTASAPSTLNAVRITGLNLFSEFGLGGTHAALPIELSQFQARAFGKRNLLKWTTQMEQKMNFSTSNAPIPKAIGWKSVRSRLKMGVTRFKIMRFGMNNPLKSVIIGCG